MDAGTIHQESTARLGNREFELAAEAGEEPEQKGKGGAEKEASDDREIKRRVFASMEDVAGKSAQAEGEFRAEVEERTDDGEREANQEKHAAEIAQWIHKSIIEEAALGPRAARKSPCPLFIDRLLYLSAYF